MEPDQPRRDDKQLLQGRIHRAGGLGRRRQLRCRSRLIYEKGHGKQQRPDLTTCNGADAAASSALNGLGELRSAPNIVNQDLVGGMAESSVRTAGVFSVSFCSFEELSANLKSTVVFHQPRLANYLCD